MQSIETSLVPASRDDNNAISIDQLPEVKTAISSLLNMDSLKSKDNNLSNLVQNGINTFEQQLIVCNNKEEKRKIISLFKNEIDMLSDGERVDQITYFYNAYLKANDMSDNLPELIDIIDLSHTYSLLGYLFVQSEKSVNQSVINKAINEILLNVDIQDLLETAKGYKGEAFEKFLAFELVRNLLKDGQMGNKESIYSNGTGYEGVYLNHNNTNMYDLFENKNESIDAEDPLFDLLEIIYGYNVELYNDIIGRLHIYNNVLSLHTSNGFSSLVKEQIDTSPSNLKSSYNPGYQLEDKIKIGYDSDWRHDDEDNINTKFGYDLEDSEEDF